MKCTWHRQLRTVYLRKLLLSTWKLLLCCSRMKMPINIKMEQNGEKVVSHYKLCIHKIFFFGRRKIKLRKKMCVWLPMRWVWAGGTGTQERTWKVLILFFKTDYSIFRNEEPYPLKAGKLFSYLVFLNKW